MRRLRSLWFRLQRRLSKSGVRMFVPCVQDDTTYDGDGCRACRRSTPRARRFRRMSHRLRTYSARPPAEMSAIGSIVVPGRSASISQCENQSLQLRNNICQLLYYLRDQSFCWKVAIGDLKWNFMVKVVYKNSSTLDESIKRHDCNVAAPQKYTILWGSGFYSMVFLLPITHEGSEPQGRWRVTAVGLQRAVANAP